MPMKTSYIRKTTDNVIVRPNASERKPGNGNNLPSGGILHHFGPGQLSASDDPYMTTTHDMYRQGRKESVQIERASRTTGPNRKNQESTTIWTEPTTFSYSNGKWQFDWLINFVLISTNKILKDSKRMLLKRRLHGVIKKWSRNKRRSS